MIKYKLNCKDCNLSFDSWFASSKEFEKIKKLNLLNCFHCSSKKVVKSLMAPNLLNTKKNNIKKEENKIKNLKKKIKEYQKIIKENFDYVGDNFTYEARSMHYNKKKPKKSIYGNATIQDMKDLKEEGIETEVIPWINEKEN